ncbi:MAG: type I glyceraldehyde-3-phosphate dehydrogenase [Magnetococcus sp. WYHC-3]
MKKIKVAINGCGRIGRAFLKLAIKRAEIEITAVNDLTSPENIAYLLKYDTAYGASGLDVFVKGGKLFVEGKEIEYLSEKDPSLLPWGKLEIDIVIESTGLFASYEKSRAHITAGAKKVLITAPVKDAPKDKTEKMVLLGVNENDLEGALIVSNASCTTNAGSPIIAILDEVIGIEKAMLNTVHAYTASQSLVDGPNKKDWREGRAGAQNIVPSSTGAAIAITKVFPKLEGKFDGISMRVPVIVGSIVDITFLAKRNTSVEEVNEVLEKASKDKKWHGIFDTTKEQLTSRDIIGNPHASIADLSFTRVVDKNLVKILAWYDNEMGYTNTLVEQVVKMGKD